MNWLTIILAAISFLRKLKGASSCEELAATSLGAKIQNRFGGEFLERLWENRDEILDFIVKIIGLIGTKDEAEEREVMAAATSVLED